MKLVSNRGVLAGSAGPPLGNLSHSPATGDTM